MITRPAIVTSSLLSLTLALHVRADQVESPAACAEGAEPLLIEYGQHTTGCGISPAVDLDSFRFQAVAGDEIRVCIRGLTDNFDVNYQLRDASNVTIDAASCSAGTFDTCGLCRQVPLEVSGQYTILISDAGTDNAGNYVLQLERVPPVFIPTVIVHGATVSGSISPVTDLDFVRFEGVAGTEIRISVLGQTDNLDPRIEVLDPQARPAEIIDQFCSAGTFSTCSFTVDRTLEHSGDHVIIVSDQGSDNGGNYQISLQCLFGSCGCLENDLDGDHQVGITDLLVLLGSWGACPEPCDPGCLDNPDTCPADANRDCAVNTMDLLRVLGSWGSCP